MLVTRSSYATRPSRHVHVEQHVLGQLALDQKHSKLFQSFSQVDDSHTRRHGGTGLGLAITKQLVELMGGTLGIRSSIGEGSTFWFTVPLELGREAVPTFEAGADVRGRRVLVVDDNRTNREIVVDLCSQWGTIVASAESGPVALRMLGEAHDRGEPFDLVVLDMQMPEMDGISVDAAVARVEDEARRALEAI